jgi:hypothetical protein
MSGELKKKIRPGSIALHPEEPALVVSYETQEARAVCTAAAAWRSLVQLSCRGWGGGQRPRRGEEKWTQALRTWVPACLASRRRQGEERESSSARAQR